MVDNTPFTELDFAQSKDNLKNFLKSQDRFKDYDFEGSNMNVLLDILAYNTYQNSVYRNMVFSELFMDSAQLRENAMSHAKELNYLPSGRQSAQATLNVNVAVTGSENTITIPKGTKFRAQCGNKTFIFITDRNRSITRSGGKYTITDLEVYEGRQLREFYTVDGSNPVPYVINNENVDINSVRVYVRDNTSVNSTRVEYTWTKDIFGISATDNVFYIEPHFDNLYKVSFGKDRFGAEPVNGNVIEIEYRVTKGEEANGARNFSPAETIAGYSATVQNTSEVARNGAERESIEDIKFFGPKSIQIQERAVTISDYEVLLKQRFPSIQTLSVYGGDQADPPLYGRVIISVDVFGTEGAGDSEIQEYKNFLADKTPLTIEPVFVPPEFLYVDLDLKVYYNPKVTTKSSDEIRQVVKDAITGYSDTILNRFNTTMRQSRLANVVDTSDISILSTDITAKPIIEYAPQLRVVTNPIFDFGDSLKQPYRFNETVGFSSYTPAITTTRFTLDGNLVTIQDNGSGQMVAVTAASSDRRIFNPNVGTVDYTTGQVRLQNFEVSRFEGNAIKIIANTINKDIRSTKNKILVLRESDINVQVIAVR